MLKKQKLLVVSNPQRLFDYFGKDVDEYVKHYLLPTSKFRDLLADADHPDAELFRSCVEIKDFEDAQIELKIEEVIAYKYYWMEDFGWKESNWQDEDGDDITDNYQLDNVQSYDKKGRPTVAVFKRYIPAGKSDANSKPVEQIAHTNNQKSVNTNT